MYEYYITPEEYDIAERNGVCKQTLEYRIRQRGWMKESAIHKPPRKQSEEKKYYAAMAKQNGVKRTTFEMRLKRGWSMKDAAAIPLRTRDSQSQRLLADEEIKRAENLGVKRTTIYMRLSRGWSKEEALNTPTISEKEALRRATAASPFREFNEIDCNMSRAKRRRHSDSK